MAYGHIGLLPNPNSWGISSTLKTHFTLLGIQQFYSKTTVSRITYHKNGSFLSLGDAIVQGACLPGQIKIEYTNGTSIIVNLGESDFILNEDEKSTVLPPGGYWAEHLKAGHSPTL